MAYRIRNWSRYQHYSKRNPPWIKLHFELLASKDWVTLSDASRVLAVASMLLASRNGGYVPDGEYMHRVAYLHTPPDFTELLKCGFIEEVDDASNLLADASISVSVSVSEVSSKEVFNNMPPILATDEFKKTWTKWREYKKQQGYPVQPMQEIELLAKLAGEGADEATEIVLHAIRKGWKSIVFDYPERKPRRSEQSYQTGPELIARAKQEQEERDRASQAATA